MRFLKHAVAASLILLGACAPAGNTVTEADFDTIRAHHAAFVAAMLAGDHDAVAAFYSENAMVMPPNSPAAIGRMAFRQTLDGMPSFGTFEVSNEEFTALGGDAILATAKYSLTAMIPGMDMALSDSGKLLEVWQREGEEWKLAWDIWNSDLPLPAPEPPPATTRR